MREEKHGKGNKQSTLRQALVEIKLEIKKKKTVKNILESSDRSRYIHGRSQPLAYGRSVLCQMSRDGRQEDMGK